MNIKYLLARSHSERRLIRLFGDKKKSNKTNGSFKLLYRILKPERSNIIKLFILTTIHTGSLLFFPYALKEVQRLSHLKVGEKDPESVKNSEKPGEENNVKEGSESSKSTDNNSKSGKKRHKIDVLGFEFDIDYLKEVFRVSSDENENELTEKDVRDRYIGFLSVFFPFFVGMGVVGYFKHMKTRRLDDFIAILLRRKIYSDLVTRDYKIFLNKNLNSGTITQKILTNTNNFTNGLMDNIGGLVRGVIFTGGGGILFFYYLPEFTLIAAGLVGVLGMSSKIFNSKVFQASKEQTEALVELSRYIGDQTNNIQSLKMMNMSKISQNHLNKKLLENHRLIESVARLWGINIAILETVGIGGLIMILCYGSYMISMGVIPSQKIMFVLYASYIAFGMRSLIMNTTSLKNKLGILEDTLDIAEKEGDFNQFKFNKKQMTRSSELLDFINKVAIKFDGATNYSKILESLSEDVEVSRFEHQFSVNEIHDSYSIAFENV